MLSPVKAPQKFFYMFAHPGLGGWRAFDMTGTWRGAFFQNEVKILIGCERKIAFFNAVIFFLTPDSGDGNDFTFFGFIEIKAIRLLREQRPVGYGKNELEHIHIGRDVPFFLDAVILFAEYHIRWGWLA